MKSLLLIASSLIILSSAFAEIVTVDVPAGYNAVVLSHTRHHSGCGPVTNYLSVLKSADGKYIIGGDIGLKNDKPIFQNLMPRLIPPQVTCMAYVSTTTKARFKHLEYRAETIEVEVPDFMVEDLKVEIQKIQTVH